MLHRHALVHQAGGVGVAELVRVDVASADLLGGCPQGVLTATATSEPFTPMAKNYEKTRSRI